MRIGYIDNLYTQRMVLSLSVYNFVATLVFLKNA